MTDTETPGTAENNPQHHVTREEDKVSVLQKIAIGAGEMSSVGRQGLGHLALPIFNIVLLVNPVLVTSVLAFARFWDAITDPLAGFISDNTRSRWGRRKPYLVASSIICGVTFPIIWFVPGAPSHDPSRVGEAGYCCRCRRRGWVGSREFKKDAATPLPPYVLAPLGGHRFLGEVRPGWKQLLKGEYVLPSRTT